MSDCGLSCDGFYAAASLQYTGDVNGLRFPGQQIYYTYMKRKRQRYDKKARNYISEVMQNELREPFEYQCMPYLKKTERMT